MNQSIIRWKSIFVSIQYMRGGGGGGGGGRNRQTERQRDKKKVDEHRDGKRDRYK